MLNLLCKLNMHKFVLDNDPRWPNTKCIRCRIQPKDNFWNAESNSGRQQRRYNSNYHWLSCEDNIRKNLQGNDAPTADEVDTLVYMLLENWDDYVAVSFMPKDTTAYPQLPEQVITEEEYNRRAEAIKGVNPFDIVESLKQIERENKMSELLDADCVVGACTIR